MQIKKVVQIYGYNIYLDSTEIDQLKFELDKIVPHTGFLRQFYDIISKTLKEKTNE